MNDLSSRPLNFKLSDPNLVSNLVQTLSALMGEVTKTKKKLQGTAIIAAKALAATVPTGFIGAYSATVSYVPGNQVTYNGSYYINLIASFGNLPTNTTYWQLVSAANPSVFLGAYNSGTAYVVGNQVTYSGSYYVNILASTAHAPTNATYWQLVSAANTVVFLGAYNSGTAYVPGNQVTSGGSYYINILTSYNHAPTNATYCQLVGGANTVVFLGVYNASTAYVQGNQVTFNGLFFECISATTGNAPTNVAYWVQVTSTLTNGGGSNIVNSLVSTTSVIASDPQTGNAFTVPGWIVGQIWSSGSEFAVFIPSTGSANQGYEIVFDMSSGSHPGSIVAASSLSGGTGFTAAGLTYYAATNPATVTGWWNIEIYIGASGYMAVWINNNLACDCTDTTYTPNTTALQYGILSGGTVCKIAPAPNASGVGSSGLNPQGSVATVSDYALSYTSTTTTITWSWTLFYIYCPDGSTYTCAASTGSATTHAGSLGTLSGTTPLEWTSLLATHTYYFTPYVTLHSDGTATMNILCTGASAPTLPQMVQVASGDGNVTCSSSVYVTAATPTSGGGGGIGGGGGAFCFSPNTRVKTLRGDVAFRDLLIGDMILTARGTWKPIDKVTTAPWKGPMLDMGDGELSTYRHHVLNEDKWVSMVTLHRFPTVEYEGTIHNLHITVEDDGSQPDTEHSYTLANGLKVHNNLPTN